MKREIAHVSLVVRDYDEAIDFYCNILDFDLVEDFYQTEQDKRWVVVKPKGTNGCSLVLGKPSKPEQEAFIGNQTGGRVFLFLATDDLQRDYSALLEKSVEFAREPATHDYGTVAVFKDLYGNLWDLVEFAEGHPARL